MHPLNPYAEGSCFQERWPKVDAIVKRILNMEYVSTVEWQNMFEDIHLITSWEESACEPILVSLTESIKEAIRRSQQRVMQNQDESALLKAYIHEWSRFFKQSEYLPQPFSTLENFLVGKHNLSGPSKRKLQDSIVRKCMLDAWDVTIFEEIKQRLEDSAMKLIQDEREGAIINSALVIGVRESCVNLSTKSTTKVWNYVVNFEAAYIKSMETFYRPRTAQFIAEQGIRNYLAYAQKQLAEEETRARWYLDSGPMFNSINKLIEACVQVFVVEYQDEILSDFPKLLTENDTARLRQCYELIQRTPDGVTPMLDKLEEFIWYAGTAELRASADVLVKDASKYVNCLLDLFNRFSTMIAQALQNHSAFLTARDKAYQRLVNDTTIFSMDIPTSVRGVIRRPESRCPELLASYCDMLLRKSPSSRHLSSDEILTRLNHVLLVLKYVNSKDVFMRGHKSHLMRRLILETSADNELEELMVERLRGVGMPAELVNNLARMFQDVKVSHDLTAEFNEKAKNNTNIGAASSGIEAPGTSTIFSPELVNIKILSSGTWLPRTQPKVSIALPPELEDFIPQVEEFYKQKHQGRNLVWQYHLSHGVVAYFPEASVVLGSTTIGSYIELEMTTLQIVVLFAWRHRLEQRLQLDSLLTATGLSDAELRRTLWSLTEHPKIERQLLLYSPQVASEKDYSNATEFWINLNFGCSHMTIGRSGRAQNRRRINMIGRLQLTQTSCEEESLAIVHLRQLRAQEAIIKIMKVRKRLAFQEMYKELIALLKDQFIPSKRLLKEVIEWLIQRRYIQREPNKMETFVYIS